MSKLFFSSIPSYLTEKQLLHFFSKHSEVIKLDLKKKKGQPFSKGYGVITLASKKHAQELLQKELILDERKILLMPNLQGKNLRKKQQHIKRKRIVIKNVPSWVSDAKLTKLFSRFGKVTSAYCVVDHQRRKPYGYVTFEQEAAAQDCAKARMIILNKSDKILCYRFNEETKVKDRQQKSKKEQELLRKINELCYVKPTEKLYHRIERIFNHGMGNLVFMQKSKQKEFDR